MPWWSRSVPTELLSTDQRMWWLESTWTAVNTCWGYGSATAAKAPNFWLSVLTEIRNRGLADVLIVCCDGLKGLPDAIEATWPQALVQTCVIHLLRASMRLCSRGRPKSHCGGLATRLHRGKRRSSREGVGRTRGTMGKSLPGCDTNMAPSLGRVHPVPAVPARASQNRVHHQRRRKRPLSTTESEVPPKSWRVG